MPKHREPLSPRQRRFVAEFLACGNATEAARRARYSERTAQSRGYKILRMPAVQTAIAEAEADTLAELRVTADRLDAELAGVAFADGPGLKSMNCAGKDKVAAAKLLYERLGVLEQRHVVAGVARIGLYTPGAGLDWEGLTGRPVDLDDSDADPIGVAVEIPRNNREVR